MSRVLRWLVALLLASPVQGLLAQRGSSSTAVLQPNANPPTVRAVIPADAPEVRLAFPARPADGPTGSRFQRQIADLPRDQRERAILRELITGNVPESLRLLKPIRVQAIDDDGVKHIATYFVMADYLAVGIDGDFFRVPITPATATAIADKFDLSLITAKVSDDLFAAAQVKLGPKPLTKDRDTVATFWRGRHQERRRADQPTQREAAQGRDLRLARPRRPADPVALRRPRRLVRRLQPRSPLDVAADHRRWPTAEGGRRAEGRIALPAAQ